MSNYLQIPKQQQYIIHPQQTYITQSPSRISKITTVRQLSPSPSRTTIIHKKQTSPQKQNLSVMVQNSPSKKVIHIKSQSYCPQKSPIRQNRLHQISPQRQRQISPVKIIEQNLSYEEVMDRVKEDERKKIKNELQVLEAELEEQDDAKTIALKKKIRSLEVQNRLQLKENKQDQKQLLEFKSKNIMLESQVQLLQKQLQEAKKEKEITENILMQKIAEIQLQNQDLSQLIYDQDSQQYIKRDKVNSVDDQTFDGGSTLIQKQQGQLSRGNSQFQGYENMLTPSTSYINQNQ